MFVALSVLAVGLTVLQQAPPPKSAETTQRVESLYIEGAALYRANKYRSAIAKFEEAYAIYPEPNLLYNMGRAHEALGELDNAINRYQECIKNPNTEPGVAEKSKTRLAVLRNAKIQSSKAVEAGGSGPVYTQQQQTEAPPPWFLIGAGVSGGLGAVAGIAGGVLYAIGAVNHSMVQNAKDNAIEGVAPMKMKEAEAAVSSGETMKTAAVASFITAGVFVVAAIPLVILNFTLGGEAEEAAQ